MIDFLCKHVLMLFFLVSGHKMPGKKCLCTDCGKMRVAKARLSVKKIKPKNGRKGASQKGRSRSRSMSPSRRRQLQRGGTSGSSGTMGYSSTMQSATQAYVQRVKNTFVHRPEVYREFISILSQVQEEESNKIDIINRAILLLDGYPDLILSFNAFLPEEYTIEIQGDMVLIKEYSLMPDMGDDEEVVEEWEYLNQPHHHDDEPPMLTGTLHSTTRSRSSSGSRSRQEGTSRSASRKLDLTQTTGMSTGRSGMSSGKNESLAYIQRVKHTYRHKKSVYDKFLVILKDFNSKSLDVVDTAHKIISLFSEKSDLVLGFNEFLPDGHSIHMYQPGSYVIQYPNGGKTECVQVMVDEILSG